MAREGARVAESMQEHLQNATIEPVVARRDVLELFLTQSDDVRRAPWEVQRAWVGLSTGGMTFPLAPLT